MTYKRYEKYKSSRIGDIPEKWILTKLKYTTDEPFMYGANESAELDDRELPRYIRITDIDDNGNLKDETYKSMELNKASEFLLFDKDILFARSGATVGKTYMYSKQVGEACFAGYLIRYRHNRKVLPEYINYFTKSIDYSDWIRLNTIQATIQNVSAEKYKNLEVPLPNISEQKIIVNFLDKKTTEIDSLINYKENLIELLKEQRQAIITEAVTKGLDKNVSMKNSGVEWIETIPANWNVSRLKHIADIEISNVDKKTVDGEKPVLLCNYTDVYYKNVINSEIEFMKATAKDEQITKFALKYQDVMITKDSESPLDIGVPAWVGEDLDGVLCGYHMAHIRCRNNALGKYIYYSMLANGIRDQYYSTANGVTRFGLGKDSIRNSIFFIPDMNEQEEIVNYLDKKTIEIDSLISDVKVGINNLKEYKQSLISEVVTGKIDVTEK